MKIPENQLPGLGSAGLGGASGAGGADRTRGVDSSTLSSTRREEHTSPDGDRVQLSGLSQALQAASEDSPERLAKVEQLRQAVQSGTYQPDPKAVGQSILNDAIGSSGGGV
ncbi:MAG: flagellar biosynthesis anti-sigma factor FlgM [Bryobacterales bacterium]|nr:flagellar biosynthesis anti-sigma factor FlgM [Bryobacterales bacterium]